MKIFIPLCLETETRLKDILHERTQGLCTEFGKLQSQESCVDSVPLSPSKKALCPYDCWHMHVITHVVGVRRLCLLVLTFHLETRSLVPAINTRCSFHFQLQITKSKRSGPIILTKGDFLLW